jgi:D-sedoheptulose 7-phosphate isomerase
VTQEEFVANLEAAREHGQARVMPTLSEPVAVVKAVFEACIAIHERMRAMDLQPVADAAAAILDASRDGRKVLLFGNGGSAADAQHMAADPGGPVPARTPPGGGGGLTTDTSVVTAVANDYTFDRVFVRQIDALGNRGDIAFGITTSGRSANVVAWPARRQRPRPAHDRDDRQRRRNGRWGSGDPHQRAPTRAPPGCQEAHRTLIHAICELVEREL